MKEKKSHKLSFMQSTTLHVPSLSSRSKPYESVEHLTNPLQFALLLKDHLEAGIMTSLFYFL